MRWLKRDMRKVGIALAALLFLFLLMDWVPLSASAYEGTSGLAAPGTVQSTPTVDLTVTALAKEQLMLQNKQLQQSNDRGLGAWLWSNAAAVLSSVLSALVVVIGALIGFRQWRTNRNDTLAKESNDRKEAQDKELRDREDEREKRSEERFQRVVTDLGNERKEARIAAAIMLLTFLQPGYEQFYRQIFDLSIAYLQPLGGYTLITELVPLDPLRQALITVFKESFKRVRGEWKEQESKSLTSDPSDYDRLGAIGIQLDQAYLVKADLRGIWMREASLRRAHLYRAKLTGAHLKGADFTDAYLEDAQLNKADLSRANFTRAKLLKTDFTEADISRANFTEADLTGANPETANTLKNTNLRGVKGLTKEQLAACKAKGAIIDEDSATNAPKPTVASPAPSSIHDAQTPAVSSAQVNTQPPSTDGSGATSSQPSREP